MFSKNNKIAKIYELGEDVFRAKDLAIIWEINNKNTLYVTLKRYADQGIIKRIYKGLYSVCDIKRLDPFYLGQNALNDYTYLSTESVLFQNGIIMQIPAYYTFVSPKSKIFEIADYKYKSRKLQDKYLFNNLGVEIKNKVRIANTSRAVADLLYFNPKYYFDNDKAIDWDEVNLIKKKVYDNSK